MVFENMLNMQAMLFLFVILGFIIRKRNIVGAQGRKDMVDLCLSVTLPFNIVHAFQMHWNGDMLTALMQVLLLSLGYNVISLIVSYIPFRNEEEKRKKTLRYGTIVSNGGFLGNPVIEGIYGTEGLFYASVFMLPVRIVMWTFGMACFIKDTPKNVIKKVCTHPCIIAIIIGLFIMLGRITFPDFINNTIEGVSNCNTPLSMMLVGMMLAEMNPKGILNKRMLQYTSIRLVGIPLVIFAITALLPIPAILRGITVIISGMPTPITAALLSAKYGGDEQYATGMIFITTILSLFTLPIWCMVLG